MAVDVRVQPKLDQLLEALVVVELVHTLELLELLTLEVVGVVLEDSLLEMGTEVLVSSSLLTQLHK